MCGTGITTFTLAVAENGPSFLSFLKTPPHCEITYFLLALPSYCELLTIPAIKAVTASDPAHPSTHSVPLSLT